jgi:hypothetical protein
MNTGELAAADASRLDQKPRLAKWLHRPSLSALDAADGRNAPPRTARTSTLEGFSMYRE